MSLISQPTTQPIESIVLQILEAMVEDWDFDDDTAPVSASARLIADLGFSSVDFVQLFVAIEEAFGRKLGFHDLIMPNDRYVDDLGVDQITTYIATKLAAPSPSSVTVARPAVTTMATKPVKTLTTQEVMQFRQMIPVPSPILPTAPNNAPVVFILSPPRSGSTLFRIMLGGHPQLFAPPELHLLTYTTLQERRKALNSDLNRHLLLGTIQAIKQIQGCSEAEAEQLMASYEDQNLTPGEFYAELQQGLGDRYLIDKTPSYTYHFDILKRTQLLFEQPYYIHLVRHPYGTIRSFQDAKLDQLVPFLRNSTFSPQERAELIWLVSHQNILTFLQQVQPSQQLRVRYEDLVKAPEPTMHQICTYLNIPFAAEMLNPYEDKDHRMIDGGQTTFQMSGDLKFHLHSEVEATMADRWRQFHTEDFLGEDAAHLAQLFEYEV